MCISIIFLYFYSVNQLNADNRYIHNVYAKYGKILEICKLFSKNLVTHLPYLHSKLSRKLSRLCGKKNYSNAVAMVTQRRYAQISSQQIKYLLLNFASCLLRFLFRLLFVGQQIVQHTLPVGVLGGAKLYPFSFKFFGAVFVAVINYYIAFA